VLRLVLGLVLGLVLRLVLELMPGLMRERELAGSLSESQAVKEL
jgi:hypothetical protein